jgi:PTH1 family peptidyl-tRNA hydrolase
MKYLIVGLGNIGAQYALTRHNAGFLATDRLADKHDAPFTSGRHGDLASLSIKGRQIHLLKPSTLMNRSGKACNYWLQHLKLPLHRMLVVADDIALPFGTLRMRAKGSNAGHNGLGDIEAVLHTSAYPRLRIGIGSDFGRGGQVDYVLSRFNEEEMAQLPDILDRCADAIESFCTVGIERTMNRFN